MANESNLDPRLTDRAGIYEAEVQALSALKVGSARWRTQFQKLKRLARTLSSEDRASLRKRGAHQLRSRTLVRAEALLANGDECEAGRLREFATAIDVDKGAIPSGWVGGELEGPFVTPPQRPAPVRLDSPVSY